LWLNRSASLLASAKTCWARGVKLFIIAFPLPGPPPDLVHLVYELTEIDINLPV
jgi:hypothetical protein